MLWQAICMCPQNNVLCLAPVEVPEGLTEEEKRARGKRLMRELHETVKRDLRQKRLPPACPCCSTPYASWLFLVESLPGTTLAEWGEQHKPYIRHEGKLAYPQEIH